MPDITKGSRLLILFSSLKGTIWLGMAQVCGVVAGFAIQAAIARYADDPKTAVGQYSLVVGCMMLAIGALTLPGLGGAIAQSVARGYDGVLRLAYSRRVRFAWLGCAALLIAAGVYYRQGDHAVAAGLIFPALGLPFIAATGSCGIFFRGRSLFGYSALWDASSKSVNAVAVAVVLLVTGNIIYALWAYVAAMLLGNVIGYLWARSLARNNDVDDGYLRFGYHLSVMTLVATLELYADRIILPAFTSIHVLSVYVPAIIIHNQFRMMVILIAQTLHPRFSRCEGVRAAAGMLAQIFVPILLVVVLACGLLWLLAPLLIDILYAGQLPQAVPYARILILAGVLFTPSILMRTVLTSQRCVRHLYVYDFAFPITQVTAWIIGAKLGSIEGMIWARVTVLALAQLLMLALLLHAVKTEPPPAAKPDEPQQVPDTP